MKKRTVILLVAAACIVGIVVGAAGMGAVMTARLNPRRGFDASSYMGEPPSDTDRMSPGQGPSPNSETPPYTSSFIGEDRAKEIALERAGLTADGVRFDRVELDRDNGVWQYEVDFQKDGIEYNADIKADDGTILNWETDRD